MSINFFSLRVYLFSHQATKTCASGGLARLASLFAGTMVELPPERSCDVVHYIPFPLLLKVIEDITTLIEEDTV